MAANAPQPQPQLAYRPDFYTPENIIGHTGKLHEHPTVYFRDGDEFGHITQTHQYGWNVGRERVGREIRGRRYYHIENQTINGALRAVEFFVDRSGRVDVFHYSRNPFIDCSRANTDQLAILASAIWRFQERKAGRPAGFNPDAHRRRSIWALGARAGAAVRGIFG